MIKKVEDITIREWQAIYPNLRGIEISATGIFIYFKVYNHMAECMRDCLNVLNLDDFIETDEGIPGDIYAEDDWGEVIKHNV